MNTADIDSITFDNYIRDNRLDKLKGEIEKGAYLTCEAPEIAAKYGNVEFLDFILRLDAYESPRIFDAAIGSNKVNVVEYLLNNTSIKPSRHGLERALEENSFDTVKYLYEHTPHLINDEQYIITAIRYDNEEIANYLIDNSKKVSQEMLSKAVEHKLDSTIKRLVDRGVKFTTKIFSLLIYSNNKPTLEYVLNHFQDSGRHPGVTITNANIQVASEYCDTECLKLVVESSKKKNLSKISVVAAAIANKPQSVIYLAEHGAKLSSKALDALASNGHIDAIDYLLKHGVKMNNKAITLAMVNRKYECAKFLLENGAKVSAPLLNMAIKGGQLDITKYLLDHGVKPSVFLFAAIKSGQLEYVKVLVDAGSTITSSQITLAAYRNRMDIIKYFIETKGCKIPYNAVYYSTINYHFDMAKYLIDHGGTITAKMFEQLRDCNFYHIKKLLKEKVYAKA